MMLRVFIFLCLLVIGFQAKADALDDDLNTAWEALWDQRGTPRLFIRWEKTQIPVKYRIYGASSGHHKAHFENAIKDASEATGLKFEDVGQDPDAEKNSMLDIEVVNDLQLQGNEACFSLVVNVQNWFVRKSIIKARDKDAWRCTYHEMMHAMGFVGHPSGKTVLSYFPYRRDIFMDLDKTLLKAAYSQSMRPGATLFEAIETISQFIVAQDYSVLSDDEKQNRRNAFLLSLIAGMEQFSMGKGDVPSIIYRSGRASNAHLANAINEMSYQLGLAYARGTIVKKSVSKALEWYERGAAALHTPSLLVTGRAYFYGYGITPNKEHGIALLKKAAQQNSRIAKEELVKIEKNTPNENVTVESKMNPSIVVE